MEKMDERTEASVEPVLARPTRHLPGGLRPGHLYWVDPTSEYVREALERRILIAADDAPPAT